MGTQNRGERPGRHLETSETELFEESLNVSTVKEGVQTRRILARRPITVGNTDLSCKEDIHRLTSEVVEDL